MAKRLQANGLWESSRIVLPEHREALAQQHRKSRIKPRPILDDDALLAISDAINRSYNRQETVTLRIYGEFGDHDVTGVVERIDTLNRRLKISGAWVRFDDIIEAVICE